MTNKSLLFSAFCLAVGIFVGATPAQAASSSPVVVELFTSQSCSSCPPADKFLGFLKNQRGVLPLSMHVDYWNALGWRDPWSSRQITARQRAYARALGNRYVSTPQAIINGRTHAVGSDRGRVLSLIERIRRTRLLDLKIRLSVKGNKLAVRIGDGAEPLPKKIWPAAVWLIAYDNQHTASIGAGENSGRTVVYSNVVRSLRRIGTWNGKAKGLNVDISREGKAGYDNGAILVQAGEVGEILGAASFSMAKLTR